jgi:ABC-type transport system involved in multi-copper enzyme maturation permease subunit
VRVVTLALSTWESFLHNRLIVLVLILAACVVLLTLFPLLAAKAALTVSNREAMEAMVLEEVSGVMSFVSGLGSVLAAWCAADALQSELRSGTVLAVMARPVRRWEFLLGKYLGVMLFMFCYVCLMFCMSYLFVDIAGMRIHAAPWVLVVYPMVRYAIYAGLALCLATLVHPVVTMGTMLALWILTETVGPGAVAWNAKLKWLKTALYYFLPSTNLFGEGRFLSLRQAALKQATWSDHAITLAYGLDCALLLVLLAMWSFHYRSLRQD